MQGSKLLLTNCKVKKIEIIQWNDNEAEFVVGALAPAEIAKVVMYEETRKMEVVVQMTNLVWQLVVGVKM